MILFTKFDLKYGDKEVVVKIKRTIRDNCVEFVT